METNKTEHVHIQSNPYRFQATTYAPVQEVDKLTGKKTCGRGRFSVETMIYISGVGWDVVDITNTDNDFLVGLYRYVKMHEDLLGYEHVGKSSTEMKNMLENLWEKKIG